MRRKKEGAHAKHREGEVQEVHEARQGTQTEAESE